MTAMASRRERTGARTSWRSRWPWMVAAIAVIAALVVIVVAVIGDDSSDGGPTGSRGEPVDEFMHVHGLAIAPWSPDEVWLSTHRGLILIDGDGHWRYASDDLHDFMGFAVHPQDEDVLYTSGHPDLQSGLDNPLGFMVSADRGRTWEIRSLHGEVDFHALAVHNADGDVIYGWDATAGRLLLSDDGGHDWQPRATPHPDGVLTLAVHPIDAATVLAGTPGGLFLSTDAGGSWNVLLDDVPVTALASDPGTPDRFLAYTAGPAGNGLIESADAARSWRSVGLDLGDDAVLHIAAHPTDSDVVYVGTLEQNVYRTVDGGARWERLAENGVRGVRR